MVAKIRKQVCVPWWNMALSLGQRANCMAFTPCKAHKIITPPTWPSSAAATGTGCLATSPFHFLLPYLSENGNILLYSLLGINDQLQIPPIYFSKLAIRTLFTLRYLLSRNYRTKIWRFIWSNWEVTKQSKNLIVTKIN